ncbi:hypothetical protein A9Q84_18225 [Halobacteriovorax marinus]|uniref:Response regulatory domain-containing protein n=1 Tax=Halobacteriovorax marinus TaxID=97084 RepID=A0A1Y5F303_9BACT|nr:hypothetical protein A9Q84_18225 [Halobacteriovorax marinus]
MKAVIIDDHEMITESLHNSLQGMNIFSGISEFNDPTEALAAIRRDFYDLYIIDINMPQIDGITLAEKIKKIHTTQPFEIILISGELNLKLIQKAKALKNEHILVKPFGPKLLKDKIYELVENLEKVA